MVRHFLVDDDLSPQELVSVLDHAVALKKDRLAERPLAGRSVALVFEKASTRTRVSFEVGVHQLGGQALVIDGASSQLGRGETLEDTAATLSRYVDAIVIRTFAQQRIERLAAGGSVPVVNALTDRAHPCQALADLMTIRERTGGLQGVTLGYVGDGNNMAHSLLLAGAAAGLHVRVASPAGYQPDEAVVARARDIAVATGGSALVTTSVDEAVDAADVVYTDVWASMGHETEVAERASAFAAYQVDDRCVSLAAPDAIVMHCLPAHRGEEIAASVLDGPQSAVWDQAENRLHAQKALLAFLLPVPGACP